MIKEVFDRIKHIATPESELKQGDWVYTPDSVYGTSPADEKHNIFQYDERIVYSQHFGHEPIFFKIIPYSQREQSNKVGENDAACLFIPIEWVKHNIKLLELETRIGNDFYKSEGKYELLKRLLEFPTGQSAPQHSDKGLSDEEIELLAEKEFENTFGRKVVFLGSNGADYTWINNFIKGAKAIRSLQNNSADKK